MNEWIILLALSLAVVLFASFGLVCRCCRQREREKNRCLVQAIHEQDRLARELEHVRAENKRLERLLESRCSERAVTTSGKTNGNS